MTAIPEPTREDFEKLQKLESWHSACVVRMSGKVIADSWQESLGSAVRLLAHFHRENERLTRQRDVLRKRIVFYQTHVMLVYDDIELCKESNDLESKEFIDALTGEGG